MTGLSCWGITDGSAGMIAQVHALANALGCSPEMKKIALNRMFGWQPNAMYAAGFKHLIMDYALDKTHSDALLQPWPALIISCGRKAALVAMGMRHIVGAGTGTKFIHIQDPQCPSSNYDFVVAMEHDKIIGPNVIKTRFALHNITPESLAIARETFEPFFASYPKPHVAVLIGGSTNKYRLTAKAMKQVIDSLDKLLESIQGSLLITPSRRTGIENIRALQEYFHANNRVYLYDGEAENTYMGLLALADYLVVTNDSVNMMSEAHATGKPLYILPFVGHRNTKPARFAEGLICNGIAKKLDNSLEKWTYLPLGDEIHRIVTFLRKDNG